MPECLAEVPLVQILNYREAFTATFKKQFELLSYSGLKPDSYFSVMPSGDIITDAELDTFLCNEMFEEEFDYTVLDQSSICSTVLTSKSKIGQFFPQSSNLAGISSAKNRMIKMGSLNPDSVGKGSTYKMSIASDKYLIDENTPSNDSPTLVRENPWNALQIPGGNSGNRSKKSLTLTNFAVPEEVEADDAIIDKADISEEAVIKTKTDSIASLKSANQNEPNKAPELMIQNIEDIKRSPTPTFSLSMAGKLFSVDQELVLQNKKSQEQQFQTDLIRTISPFGGLPNLSLSDIGSAQISEKYMIIEPKPVSKQELGQSIQIKGASKPLDSGEIRDSQFCVQGEANPNTTTRVSNTRSSEEQAMPSRTDNQVLENYKQQENSENIPIPVASQIQSNEVSVEKQTENIIQYKLRSSETSSNVRKPEKSNINQNIQSEQIKNKSLNKIGSFRSVSSGSHKIHDSIESHVVVADQGDLFRSLGPYFKTNQLKLDSAGSNKSSKIPQPTTYRKDLSQSQQCLENTIMTQRSTHENHKIVTQNLTQQTKNRKPIDQAVKSASSISMLMKIINSPKLVLSKMSQPKTVKNGKPGATSSFTSFKKLNQND